MGLQLGQQDAVSQLHRPTVGDLQVEMAPQAEAPAMVITECNINGDNGEQQQRGSIAPLELQGLNDNGQGVDKVLRNLLLGAEERAPEEPPMVVEATVEKAQAQGQGIEGWQHWIEASQGNREVRRDRARDENEMRRKELRRPAAAGEVSAGPRQDEGNIEGDCITFGPEVVEFDRDQSREVDIDMGAAIEAAIAASLQDGPDRGGLVEQQVGDFVQPPLCPFERMDAQSRQRLQEAEAAMAKGEELPAGPQYGQANPEGWRENRPWRQGAPHRRWKQWAAMVPRVDGVAMDIIKHYVIRGLRAG